MESQNGFYYDAAGEVGQIESGITNSGSQAVKFSAAGTSGQHTSNVDTLFVASPGDESVTVQIAAMFIGGNSGSLFEVFGLDSSAGLLTQLLYRDGVAYLPALLAI